MPYFIKGCVKIEKIFLKKIIKKTTLRNQSGFGFFIPRKRKKYDAILSFRSYV